MNKPPISTSPDRHKFQRQNYLTRKLAEGVPEHDADLVAMLQYLDHAAEIEQHRIQDPSWSENNLEYDLRTTGWILQKVRDSRSYAQNLYAVMCNNEFQKMAVMPILTDQTWCCSWRYAGGIVAHMRESGDYIDWYCSGISHEEVTHGMPHTAVRIADGFVPESTVTAEIAEDLYTLGWQIILSE